MKIKRKIFINKKTGQPSVTLPIELIKKKKAKFLKISEKDLE